MGVAAHLRRLALGRSSDEPPDWDSLTDQYEVASTDKVTGRRTYRCVNKEDPIAYGRIFDEKGRPYHPEMHDFADKQAEAMDAVIKYVVDHENSLAKNDRVPRDTTQHEQSPSPLESCKPLVFAGLSLAKYATHVYLRNLMVRVLVWKSLDGMSFLDIIAADLRRPGFTFELILSCFYRLTATMVLPSLWASSCDWVERYYEEAESHSFYANFWKASLEQLHFMPLVLVVDLEAAGLPILSNILAPSTLQLSLDETLFSRIVQITLPALLYKLVIAPAAFAVAQIDYGACFDPNPSVERLLAPVATALHVCEAIQTDYEIRGLNWLIGQDGFDLSDDHWFSAHSFLLTLRPLAADLVLLPFNALWLRSISAAYVATMSAVGNADAAAALGAGLRMSSSSWDGTAGGSLVGYASKVGLCFALETTSYFVFFGASLALGSGRAAN